MLICVGLQGGVRSDILPTQLFFRLVSRVGTRVCKWFLVISCLLNGEGGGGTARILAMEGLAEPWEFRAAGVHLLGSRVAPPSDLA